MRIRTAALVGALICVFSPILLGGQPTPTATTASAPKVLDLRDKIATDNRANPVASVRWAEEGLQVLGPGGDAHDQAWFLLALVRDLNTLGEFQKASGYLERGRSVVAGSKDERSRLLLEVESVALLTNSERIEEGGKALAAVIPQLESYLGSHPLDREFAQALGRSYRILGSVLQVGGKYPQAIRANQNAQNVFNRIRDTRGRARVLENMGLVYIALGRYDEAVASYRQAISDAEALADLVLQGTFHLELANAYSHMDRVDTELAELKMARDLAGRAQDSYTQLLAFANLTDAYLRKKDYRATLGAADEALASPGISRYGAFVAGCLLNRGIALCYLGRKHEGITSIQGAMDHYRGSQARTELMESTGCLAEGYATAGDYRQAYLAEKEFKALSDDLKRTKDQRRIAEASAAFEADKKQILIEGLQREQQFHARQKALWISISLLGFCIIAILVAHKSRLQQANSTLNGLNHANRALILDLQSALSEVRTLQGLIPICAHCKKIRDDKGSWSQLEVYIQNRTAAQFSHGICPECAEGILAEFHSGDPVA